MTGIAGWIADPTSSAIADWDVSAVEDMRDLFEDKTTFNADLSKWDVGEVTTMSYMF